MKRFFLKGKARRTCLLMIREGDFLVRFKERAFRCLVKVLMLFHICLFQQDQLYGTGLQTGVKNNEFLLCGINGREESGFSESVKSAGLPDELKKRMQIENSLAVLVNRGGIIPFLDISDISYALLLTGDTGVFASRLNDYLKMPVVHIDPGADESVKSGIDQLRHYDRIIAGIYAGSGNKCGYCREKTDDLLTFLKEKETVAVFFGSGQCLAEWKGLESIDGLVFAPDTNVLVQDLAAQLIFGAIGASGTLAGSAGENFPAGWGIHTTGGYRLKYTIPEEEGLDSGELYRLVDSIIGGGLEAGAFPGCRVLAAIDGRIIFDRAWGYHTYAGRVSVQKDDIYDLASVTKIAGPLPLIMKLADEGAIDIDMPLSHYWDDWKCRLFRRSNKEDLILRDLLTHQSGIVPYINYWERTFRRGNYIRRWYRHESLEGYSIEIGSHLFLKDSFRNRVYRDIRKSDLQQPGRYRYSCLPFIILPEVISEIEGRPYVQALCEDFFKPLGATSLRYNPLEMFSPSDIVPTEIDAGLRRNLVHGYVHDEASAVLGGISGNAGLFSSAGDLAKLLQMYLNGGVYGGRRYLSEEVINEFTRVQYPENNNRRGLGFDKPVLDNPERAPKEAYPSSGASLSSYGHSGFTGTFVWMDPEYDLLYIFLSNRVHPSRDNNIISALNIRTEVLQVFYELINRQSD